MPDPNMKPTVASLTDRLMRECGLPEAKRPAVTLIVIDAMMMGLGDGMRIGRAEVSGMSPVVEGKK